MGNDGKSKGIFLCTYIAHKYIEEEKMTQISLVMYIKRWRNEKPPEGLFISWPLDILPQVANV